MKTCLLFTFFLLLVSLYTHAQLNESDTVRFQLRTSLTGNYQQGNVEVLTVRAKLDFTFAPLKNLVFKSQNSSLYQAFYAKKADNDIFSRNYLYYKPTNKVYPFGIVYVSTNYRRRIYSRFFSGAGCTWQVLNTGRQVLKLSSAVVYEHTAFRDSVYNYPRFDGNNKVRLWRATLYTGGWIYLFGKHLRLFYDAYYQPAFNYRENYRVQSDIGLDFPVWKNISFNAMYTFTHENLVIKNIKKEDKILSFGVACFFKRTHT